MTKEKEGLEPEVSPIHGGSTSPVDLSTVNTESRRLVGPRLTIPWDSSVGLSSTKGAEESKKAAQACKLSSTLAASLKVHQDDENPTAIYGIPWPDQSPANLNLEWLEQGRRFRTNLAAVLRLKKINIPKGSRMLINLEQIVHPKLGPCLRLWWDKDCFIPIKYQDDDET